MLAALRQGPLPPFPAAVLATARRRRLFGSDDRVLVALSGGPDSTALLTALVALRYRGRLADVCAVHVDHKLRRDSHLDAEFCAALCDRLRVPLECVEVRVAPGNIQAEARRARYAALRAAAAHCGATRIATGHTRGDQAETVLLRLLRGAGARGLSGIPPRRGALVRPLIDRSRAEVIAFLADLGLPWREDPTNASPRYLRNRVRSEILPALASVNPSVEAALARAADLLREDERALDRRARELVSVGPAGALDAGSKCPAPVAELVNGGLLTQSLLAEPRAVRRRMVRRMWRAATGSRSRLSAAHVDAVLKLLGRAGPGRVTLPGGLEARCAYSVLLIGAAATPTRRPPEISIPAPGVYGVPGHAFRIEVAAADEAGTRWPLCLRARRPGDRFRPEGGRGSKKLKSWLIDRKVPREYRDSLLLLVDRDGEVLWIPELSARSDALRRAAGLALRLLPTGEGPGVQ